MKRRSFIKYTSATAGIASYLKIGQLSAYASNRNYFTDFAGNEDRILVIIQLFGGNDGLNTIIPAEDDRYYNKYRTTLNIPKNQALRLGNTNSYLNPSLKVGQNEGLYGLFKEGKLGVIQGIGYPKPNLSHFRSTDIWLSGVIPENDSQRLETGWLGRYFEKVNPINNSEFPNSIDIGTSSSLLFQSATQNTAISLENPNDFYESGKDILTGDSKLTEKSVFASERNYLFDLSLQSNKYSAVVKNAFDKGKNVATYQSQKLSDELKLVARLISGGLKTKVYKVSIDGFDTHAGQGTTDGKHASLLAEISNAVGSFMADLKSQKLSEKVIGMTVSEFGRRPEQNASSGTDHGAASVMFMFGDNINGRVFGKNLSFDSLNTNKDFVHQFDYRQVYDEIMTKWFSADTNLTKEILSGRFNQIESGLISFKNALSNEPIIEKNTSVFPNPTTDGNITLQLWLEKPTAVNLEFIDMLGKTTKIIEKQSYAAGNHQIPLSIQMNSNFGFLKIYLNERVETHKIFKL